MADDRERVDAERVGDRGDVARGGGDVPAGRGRGPAVSGAVVAEPADAERLGQPEQRRGGAPTFGVPCSQNTGSEPLPVS
jgi:hypothetical protein